MVPCCVHPSTDLAHPDGPCRCFTGGPPPVHVPAAPPRFTSGMSSTR